MTVQKHRVYVALDIMLDFPDETWHEDWWKAGAADFFHIQLNHDGVDVRDVTVYKSVSDMVGDMEDKKDMFKISLDNEPAV